MADRWEVSGRAIYDWSSRNSRPPAAPFAQTVDARRERLADLHHPPARGHHAQYRLGWWFVQVVDHHASSNLVEGLCQI